MTAIILLISLVIMQIILKIFDKFMRKSKMDALVYKILRIVLKGFLLFTIVIIVLSSLGISVSAAFVFGSHLAFTMAFDSRYILPMIVGKLISGVCAVILAAVLYKDDGEKGTDIQLKESAGAETR